MTSEIALLEERVAALEQRVAQLKQSREAEDANAEIPWWEQRFGSFANSEAYDDAMRLGREYRESLRPDNEESED